jgi:hypothetical protein
MAQIATADGTLIRWHKMGEQEGGVNNASVFSTLDSPVDGGDVQPLDLSAQNTPTYRTITGRLDGGGGIGIEFNAAQQENLNGLPLNWPEESALSDAQGGQYDFVGIADRSMQFWARPTTPAVQSLVMDTNEHGVRINSNGKFSMRYAKTDYESVGLPVVSNSWYHIEVVRPDGVASRSRMYVNGMAVAVSAAVDYAADTATNLTVGSNTSGNGEFYSGIVDELRMTVYGISDASTNFGSYSFASENDYADFVMTGIPGDINHMGGLTQADKDAFIAGWMFRKVINGFQIGDLETFGKGDLNLDGVTDIFDLALMQDALFGAGMGAITEAELLRSSVPEPTTMLLFAGIAWIPFVRRRGRRAT